MKKLITIVLMFSFNLSFVVADVKVGQDISGKYLIKFKKFFTGAESFEINLHKLKPNQDLGDIDFFSARFGECSNIPQISDAPEYGYNFYKTDDALTGLKLPVGDMRNVIESTIFCKDKWYNMLIELPLDALTSGLKEIPVGFYFQDADFDIPLKAVGVMTKIY